MCIRDRYAAIRWAGRWAWRSLRGSLRLAAAGAVSLAGAAARLAVHAVWAACCRLAPQRAAALQRRVRTAVVVCTWLVAAAARCRAAVALRLRWAAAMASYARGLHRHARRVAAHTARLRGWRVARARRQVRRAGVLTIRRRALDLLMRRRAASWRASALAAAHVIGREARAFVGRRRAALAAAAAAAASACLLYTSPSPRDRTRSRMPSSA